MIVDLFCPIDTVVIGGKKKEKEKKEKCFVVVNNRLNCGEVHRIILTFELFIPT